MTDADPSQLERVYRENGDRLWRAVFAWSADREIASDAVAEAFVQALGRGEAIRDPAAWVWRAAFRIAAGELKSRRRDAGTFVDAGYELPEPADELVRALARLSPKQRSAVVLHHYAGYRAKEIARMIDSTAPAVKVHLSAGRNRLRAFLAEEDES